MSTSPTTPSQPSQPSQDLTPRDCYLVALHLANLVITIENFEVKATIRKRIQRCLDEAIAEYDAACQATHDWNERFES